MYEIKHQDYVHPITGVALPGTIATKRWARACMAAFSHIQIYLSAERRADLPPKSSARFDTGLAEFFKYVQIYLCLHKKIRRAGTHNFMVFARAYVLACRQYRALVRGLIGEDKIKAWWKRAKAQARGQLPGLPKLPKFPKAVKIPRKIRLNLHVFGLELIRRFDLTPPRVVLEAPVSLAFGFTNPTRVIRFHPQELDVKAPISNDPLAPCAQAQRGTPPHPDEGHSKKKPKPKTKRAQNATKDIRSQSGAKFAPEQLTPNSSPEAPP